MKNNNTSFHFIKRMLLGLLGMVGAAQASNPVWSITPLTSTQLVVPPTGTASVQYQVTNNSRTHTLVMRPIRGVTQVTSPGSCANPFTLNQGQSCVLSLLVNGSQLNRPIAGGPELCQANGGQLQCYRPTKENSLRLSQGPVTVTYTLGGHITGLIGSVTLRNNNGDTLTQTTNGAFTFPMSLPSRSAYDVTVLTQPAGQTCTVGNGTGTISGSNVNDVSVHCVNRLDLAFVVNVFDNSVAQCTVNPSTGAFTDCANTGGTNFNAPRGIVLNSEGTRAFVTNGGDNTVTQCTVNASTGAFTDCANTGGTNFNFPICIVLNSAGTRAFVANSGDDAVIQCTVNASTGAFTDCANTGGTNSHLPRSIVLNSAGTRAFMTDFSNNTVIQCTVNTSTGAFTDCANTGGTNFNFSSGIVLNSAETRAFVTNFSDNTVTQCTVNPSTGAFTDCANTGGADFDRPYGIVLK